MYYIILGHSVCIHVFVGSSHIITTFYNIINLKAQFFVFILHMYTQHTNIFKAKPLALYIIYTGLELRVCSCLVLPLAM